MPLYKTLNNRQCTRVLVWKVTEDEASLARGIVLSKNSINRLSRMGSELHRRGFLSIRHLLVAAGYLDTDLFYSEEGKPFLEDGTHISITHSYHFTAIILSNIEVGIDIEMCRDKIKRIAPKFIGYEDSYLDSFKDSVAPLTVIWGAKESMYKLFATRGLGFKEHCRVSKFTVEEGSTIAQLDFKGTHRHFDAFFAPLEDFIMVYVLPRAIEC